MTKKTKNLKSTLFLSLGDGEMKWSKVIYKVFNKYPRNITKDEMSKNNFNITFEAVKIEKNI